MTPARRGARPVAAATVGAALLVAALFTTAPAAEIDGYFEEGIATRFDKGDLLYHRQTLNMRTDGYLSDGVYVRLDVDVWHDDPDFEANDEFHARIREGYFRFGFENADLRIGRQQIAWGEADGVIVSDQVSPFNLTNFILPPFDAIRLGVDGATLDYYFDNGNELQLIYIAKFQRPDLPPLASPWSFIDGSLFTGDDPVAVLAPFDKPSGQFENSEFGGRFSGHPIWCDWSIGYLHTIDDRPAPRNFGRTVTPTHDFFELVTANLAVPVADVLLRFDTAMEFGRFLSTRSPGPIPTADSLETASVGFVDRHNIFRGLVAVDFQPNFEWWHQAEATVQYVHEEVFDPHAALADPDKTDLVAVLLRAAYVNETIKPWLFAIANVRGHDAWLQAKVDYEPWQDWRVTLEFDFFFGRPFDPTRRRGGGGTFGRFDDNDLVQLVIRRSF